MSEVRPGSPVRLVAGASIAIVLVGALIISSLGDGNSVGSNTTPASVAREPIDLPATAPDTADPTLTTASVDDEVATSTTAGVAASLLPSSTASLGDAGEAGNAALAAWGRFAVSGDLADLDGRFHPDSPQYPLLVGKAAELAADPLGPPPYSFVMAEAIVEEVSPNRATMQGLVAATRGDRARQSDWRLVLVWSEETRSWLVWTLEEVG